MIHEGPHTPQSQLTPDQANIQANRIASQYGLDKWRVSRKKGWLTFTNVSGYTIIVDPKSPQHRRLNKMVSEANMRAQRALAAV